MRHQYLFLYSPLFLFTAYLQLREIPPRGEQRERKLSPVASCTEQRQGPWISIFPSWEGCGAGVKRPVQKQWIILTFSETNGNSKDTACNS